MIAVIEAGESCWPTSLRMAGGETISSSAHSAREVRVEPAVCESPSFYAECRRDVRETSFDAI